MLRVNIPLPDLASTQALAETIASRLGKRDFLALAGDVGTGKTTFARFLLQRLGVSGDIPSPTFTLLQTYETPELVISHFDLYRLKSEAELDELGWDDALAAGITFVEWPELVIHRMPGDRLFMRFLLDADGMHSCHIDGGERWQEWLESKRFMP